MWLRCRNPLSGHEASIPVDLFPHLPGWKRIKGAKPDDTFREPTYSTEPPAQGSTPPEPASTGKSHEE